MSILWRPSMAIDNGIIDHDHQVLLSIINDFDEAIPNVSGKTYLERTLAKLHHYINMHMGREEHLQAAVKFPERKEHHEQHCALRHRLNVVSKKVAALDLNVIEALRSAPDHSDFAFVDDTAVELFMSAHEEIKTLLRTWLVDHIIKSDLQMTPYVEAMRPFAKRLPSLWNAEMAMLAPNTETPQAAHSAFLTINSWMPAKFSQEKVASVHQEPVPPEVVAATKEHPTIARMRAAALRAGLVLEIDTDCTHFKDPALRDALSSWRKVGKNEPTAFEIGQMRNTVSSFKENSALFVRVAQAGSANRHFASKAGDTYSRIFGAIEGQMLDTVLPDPVMARWQILLDGVLEFGAPLRVIGRANAFGRSDLMMEGLLAPFRDHKKGIAEVLAVASYDISI